MKKANKKKKDAIFHKDEIKGEIKDTEVYEDLEEWYVDMGYPDFSNFAHGPLNENEAEMVREYAEKFLNLLGDAPSSVIESFVDVFTEALLEIRGQQQDHDEL